MILQSSPDVILRFSFLLLLMDQTWWEMFLLVCCLLNRSGNHVICLSVSVHRVLVPSSVPQCNLLGHIVKSTSLLLLLLLLPPSWWALFIGFYINLYHTLSPSICHAIAMPKGVRHHEAARAPVVFFFFYVHWIGLVIPSKDDAKCQCASLSLTHTHTYTRQLYETAFLSFSLFFFFLYIRTNSPADFSTSFSYYLWISF